MNLFIDMRWLDVIDILLVAFLIYLLYNIVRGTVAIRIFLGIFALYLFWKFVEALKMELLSEILGQFIGVGVIALIIVFQQEIRRFLLFLGNTRVLQENKFLDRLFGWSKRNNQEFTTDINAIYDACRKLSLDKTGALIVIKRSSLLESFISSSVELNAQISSALLESIFFKNSPLHDGAVVIEGNTILVASAVLPVSERRDMPSQYGMRHRAALGLSETADALVIVISEESGEVSLVLDGELESPVALNELKSRLMELLRKS
jgi:diadenylate cyclase